MSEDNHSAEVITWYLQLTDRDQFKPIPFFQEKARVELVAEDGADGDVNRWFYEHVGESWQWTDRANWTQEQWQDYVLNQKITTGVGYLAQDEIGYFELQQQNQGVDVELVYFGLLPEFVGQGLGAGLLTAAVEAAWALNPKRVWVHTCSLDHPHALRNYRGRGFDLYNTVSEKLT